MASLARWCFRHRRLVVLGWLLGVVVLVGFTKQVGTAYSDNFTLPGTESTTALNLLSSAFPGQSGDSDTIVIHTKEGQVTDPAVQSHVEAMLTEVGKLPSVAAVASPYDPAGARQISKDGRTAYATVTFDKQAQALPKADVQKVIDTAEAARTSTLQVELGGNAIKQVTQTPPSSSEGVGLIAAGIILFIAFGSLFAMALPLDHRDRRAEQRPADDRPGLARHRHRHRRSDPRRTDRPGRRHRLRAVHRHAAPNRAPDRAHAGGVRGQGAGHLGPGGPVRRRHGVHRAARAVRASPVVPQRPGHPRGAHRRVQRLRCGHPAAGAVRLLRHQGPQPQEPPPAGRRGRARAAPGRLLVPLGRRSSSIARRPWRSSRPLVMLALAIPVLHLRLGSSDSGNDPASSTTRQAYDLLAEGFGPGFNGPLQLVAEVGSPRGRGRADLAGHHAAARSRRRLGGGHPAQAGRSRRRSCR